MVDMLIRVAWGTRGGVRLGRVKGRHLGLSRLVTPAAILDMLMYPFLKSQSERSIGGI